MRKLTWILLLAVAALMFTSCFGKKGGVRQEEKLTYADFIDSGKRIAVESGDVFTDVARDVFKAEPQEYALVADMLEAMRMGRADAVMLGGEYAKQLMESGGYPDVDCLTVPEDVYVHKAAPVFHTEELRDRYNDWFAGIVADGTWKEITDRWIGGFLPAQEDIPVIESTGENGTLRVCDTGNYPPMSYLDANGDLTGFDMEMVSRFAQYMGMKLEVTTMDYSAVIPYVISGKADMSACTLGVTEERQGSVIFGEPSVITQAVLVVPAARKLSYTDFSGKNIGVMTGSIWDGVVTNVVHGNPVFYSDTSIGIEDAKKGRIDGVIVNESTMRDISDTEGNENLQYVEIPPEFYTFACAFISMDQSSVDRFNTFLAEITEDGTLNDIQQYWLSESLDLDAPMPEIPASSGENGVIKIASSATQSPYVYAAGDGTLKGYCIELILRFAAWEGKKAEIADMEFSGLIPYIVSGKAEFGVADFGVTEERKKSVLFTDSILTEEVEKVYILTAPDVSANADGGGFIEWLKTGIERNLITDNRWKMVVDGLGVTMVIAVLSQLFGTLFGCAVCWLLTRKNKFLKLFGNFYCGLIHGTPVVVLLMITYYIIFGSTSISNVLVAVAAFTLVTGAGIAESLEGAIETVDAVEIEAARSIGFSAFNAFLTVTLPQAVRRVLPSYTNGFVELVKATAIVGYIAIQDLTRAGDIIRSRTYDAYFPLLFIAVIYLAITTICIQLFKFIVKKINGGDDR